MSVVCPPGLEYLTLIDQLIIEQQAEILEVVTGFETGNTYVVKNSVGQFLYEIKERSGCCARLLCGPRRCLELEVLDFQKAPVMRIIRPLRCVHCWCFCCLQKLEVEAPVGTPIAYVYQDWSICYPRYTIYDKNMEPAFKIVGPICTMSMPCCCDVKFEVRTTDGVPVGMIMKKWTGLVKEHFTDADNFGVNFPMDTNVHIKAALMAATMLIDYMFFEETYKQKSDRAPGMMA